MKMKRCIFVAITLTLIAPFAHAAADPQMIVAYQQMKQCGNQAIASLQSCQAFSCSYHNVPAEQMMGRSIMSSYSVNPMPNNNCGFTDNKGNVTIQCTLSVSQRQQLSGFLQQSLNADSMSYSSNGGTAINGRHVNDVYNGFLQQGVCK